MGGGIEFGFRGAGREPAFLNHLLLENRKFCYSVWIGAPECAH